MSECFDGILRGASYGICDSRCASIFRQREDARTKVEVINRIRVKVTRLAMFPGGDSSGSM
jgi:hypothetical protein